MTGSFEIVRRIGSGGTGEVHEGVSQADDGTSRRIAVKILHDDAGEEPGRLRALVETLADCTHPNVVLPFEFVATPKGRVLLMEYHEGLTLSEALVRLRRAGRTVSFPLVLEVLTQVLNGLEYLHHTLEPRLGAPLIHQLLKPSNILLCRDGRVRILDAAVPSPQANAGRRTSGLAVMGLLPYLSPEQLTAGKVTTQTDLYALATVAYEFWCGRPLFDGSVARRELEIRVGFGVADKLKALDAQVPGAAQFLAAALATQPSERFASAHLMRQALRTLGTPAGPAKVIELVESLIQDDARPVIPARPVVETRPAPVAEAPVGAAAARPMPKLPPAAVAPVPRRNTQLLRVGVGLLGLLVAFLALWWVDHSRQFVPSRKMVVTERALSSSSTSGSSAEAPVEVPAGSPR